LPLVVTVEIKIKPVKLNGEVRCRSNLQTPAIDKAKRDILNLVGNRMKVLYVELLGPISRILKKGIT